MAEDTQASAAALGRRIVRAMLVIIFFGLFLKLGGFLIYQIVNTYAGRAGNAKLVTDIFTAVYGTVVFLIFFSSVLKTILPAFMPLFAESMHHDGEEAAWRFTNTVLNLVLVGGIVVAGLTFVFAADVIATLLPRFSPDAQAAASVLLRWMVPGVVVMFLAVITQAVLNSYKIFSFPSAAEAAQKLTWAVAVFLIVTVLGYAMDASTAPHILGAGFLAGCLVQAGVLLAGLGRRLRLYRPGFPAMRTPTVLKEAGWIALAGLLFVLVIRLLNHCSALPADARFHLSQADRKSLIICGALAIGTLYAVFLWYRGRRRRSVMARFAYLAGALLIGTLFARFRDVGTAFFQSYTKLGDFAVIEFAKKVTLLPGTLLAYSLSIAMFPFLCDLAARKDTEGLGATIGRTLRIMALFFLPLTALTMVMSGPVMQLLWDRGHWSPADVQKAQLALGVLATGIFFLAVEHILMQSYFSLQRMVLPTALGIAFSVLYSVSLYLLVVRLGYDKPDEVFLIVCIADPLRRALKNALLMIFLQRRIHFITLREALDFGTRLLLVCAVASAAAWGTYRAIANALPLAGFGAKGMRFELGKCLHVGIPSLACIAVFILACFLFKVEEFHLVVQWVRNRGWKKARAGTGAAGDDAPAG